MGYSASFSGTLELIAAHEAATALHALTPTHPGADDPVAATAKLLAEWLPLEECNIYVNAAEGATKTEHPTISLSGYGKLHSEEEAFAAIAEHVRGCIEFTGEDDTSWRVRFTGGAPIEDSGVIVYDCDDLDGVEGIWIGQMGAHVPGEHDIIVTATSYASAQSRLAAKCRQLLTTHAAGQVDDPEALTDSEVLSVWSTETAMVRWDIYTRSADS